MSGGIFGDPVGAFPGQSGQGQKGVVLDNIYQVSPMFLGDLGAYFTANPFPIPISQVDGYTAQTPYQATPVNAEESTSSAVYVDLHTLGPQLTTLPDGLYAITWGAAASISSSLTRAKMSISVNSAAPDNTLQAYTASQSRSGISYSTSLRIAGGQGGNTVTCQYAIGASPATAVFGGRYLYALRISGP